MKRTGARRRPKRAPVIASSRSRPTCGTRSAGSRARGYAFVAVSTMAIGIGAATAAFSLVHGVLLSAPPFPEADRIVAVYEAGETSPDLPMSLPNFRDWKVRTRTLDRMAAAFQLRVAVGTSAAPAIVDAARERRVLPDLRRAAGPRSRVRPRGRGCDQRRSRRAEPRVLAHDARRRLIGCGSRGRSRRRDRATSSASRSSRGSHPAQPWRKHARSSRQSPQHCMARIPTCGRIRRSRRRYARFTTMWLARRADSSRGSP